MYLSFVTGIFPDLCEIERVVPVHKSIDGGLQRHQDGHSSQAKYNLIYYQTDNCYMDEILMLDYYSRFSND